MKLSLPTSMTAAAPPPPAAPPAAPAAPVALISPVEEIVADMRLGRMVILTDEENRENEGDLVLAADCVKPEAINFMARHARGLICLALTHERCQRLNLPMMVAHNQSSHGTAFTVSIEAATGVSTGISAADRAHTVATAVAAYAKPSDLVQPGHIFPLQAAQGGVLMRAGHTEAGCDLARLAGCSPAAVICEIMNDDGSMARMPDLQVFAAQHRLKIGTIADLIAHRLQHESLIERVAQRQVQTPWGEWQLQMFSDQAAQQVHLALIHETPGHSIASTDTVMVRVHEPLSLLDVLLSNPGRHSWTLDASLRKIKSQNAGVAVLLNCGGSQSGGPSTSQSPAQDLLAILHADKAATAPHAHAAQMASRHDLRTYGIGAQILRSLGVHRMQLLGQPRKMPSMTGYGLEVVGYEECGAAA